MTHIRHVRWNLSGVRVALLAMAVGLGGVAPARAGLFEGVLEGLRFSSFVVDRDFNHVLNQGIGVVATNFQGNTLDVGMADLTLAGPISAVIRSGGRGLKELDFTLSTGLLNVNPNQVVTVGQAQPLAYALNIDTGTNTTNISGNFLLDARGKINQFGSYDLRLQFSDRQTTTVNGRFDDNAQHDFNMDIGPIDIEGNIIADLLANLTDPFFEAAGQQNIFALFSGRTFREQQSASLIEALRAKVEHGGSLTDDDLSTIAGLSFVSRVLGDELPDLEFVANATTAASNGLAIPEPATICLLAIGSCAVIRRRRSATIVR